ncbi:ochratoxin highly reducing polyketide synthase ota1 [Aspergillus niger]|nr:ochratoxin highly reducing polyketide synthase ota1 [Aspergillus niger]
MTGLEALDYGPYSVPEGHQTEGAEYHSRGLCPIPQQIQARFLCHALLIDKNHWQPRSGQLCGHQHLPKCLCGSTGYPGLSTRPPLSVWTACSGQGWVAENQHKVPMALAYGALSEELLLSILEYHMDTAWKAARSTQTCQTVVGIRSAQNFQRQCFPLPGFMAHPLFTLLQAIAGRSQAVGQVAEAPFSHGLREAATMEAAVKVVTRAILHEVARIMALSVQEIDPQRSLGSYGVDFRMTVDFKAWFQREVGMSMGTAELLGELARTQLAQQAADASQFLPAELRGG